LAGIEVQSWRERSLDVPAGEELVVIFVDSKPNYINIYNYGLNQIYVSRTPGGGSTRYDFTVPPLSNRQWAWADWVSAVYLWQGGPAVDTCRVTTYTSAFDPASVVQSGQTVIVAEALNIASMPAANISNNILNVNPLIVLGNSTSNLSFGPYSNLDTSTKTISIDLFNNILHDSPLGVFDTGWLYIESVDGYLANLAIKPFQMNLLRHGVLVAYFPDPKPDLSVSLVNNNKKMSASFPIPLFPFDNITFTLSNKNEITIPSSVFNFTLYGKYGA